MGPAAGHVLGAFRRGGAGGGVGEGALPLGAGLFRDHLAYGGAVFGVLFAGGVGLGAVEEERGQGGQPGGGVAGFHPPGLAAGSAQCPAGGGTGQDLYARQLVLAHAGGRLEQRTQRVGRVVAAQGQDVGAGRAQPSGGVGVTVREERPGCGDAGVGAGPGGLHRAAYQAQRHRAGPEPDVQTGVGPGVFEGEVGLSGGHTTPPRAQQPVELSPHDLTPF